MVDIYRNESLASIEILPTPSFHEIIPIDEPTESIEPEDDETESILENESKDDRQVNSPFLTWSTSSILPRPFL